MTTHLINNEISYKMSHLIIYTTTSDTASVRDSFCCVDITHTAEHSRKTLPACIPYLHLHKFLKAAFASAESNSTPGLRRLTTYLANDRCRRSVVLNSYVHGQRCCVLNGRLRHPIKLPVTRPVVFT